MKRKQIREEARLYFVPFLLGDTMTAHKLSFKIFKRYGIVSLILDTKKTVADLWDFSSRFKAISQSKSQEIAVMQLKDLAAQTQYTLPLLIPCSNEYTDLVKKHSSELESEFIILNADISLEDSPLAIIPN